VRLKSLANPFLVFCAALVGLVALGYVGLRSPPNQQPALQGTIVRAAERAGDGGTVRLADLVSFEWDRFYVFGSGATTSAIGRTLGFDWSPLSPLEGVVSAGIPMPSDGLFLLVFVSGEKDVTGWVEVNGDGDPPFLEFGDSVGAGAIQRDRAVFMVRDVSKSTFNGQYEGWELDLAGYR
jgi:hypothetical protein